MDNEQINLQHLQQKLVEIQQRLKVAKNQYNDFGGFNYRSCEDILEAVKPLLGNLSLILDDDIVNVGIHNYVKATVFLSDGKSTIRTSAYARESESRKGMDDSQITGACSSYARKYALNGLFAIDDTKDPDATINNPKKTEPRSKAVSYSEEKEGEKKIYATPKQVTMIAGLLNKKGQKDEDLKAKYNVESKNDLTIAQASQIIENLLKLPDVELPVRDINDD